MRGTTKGPCLSLHTTINHPLMLPCHITHLAHRRHEACAQTALVLVYDMMQYSPT